MFVKPHKKYFTKNKTIFFIKSDKNKWNQSECLHIVWYHRRIVLSKLIPQEIIFKNSWKHFFFFAEMTRNYVAGNNFQKCHNSHHTLHINSCEFKKKKKKKKKLLFIMQRLFMKFCKFYSHASFSRAFCGNHKSF